MKPLVCVILSLLLAAGCAESAVPADISDPPAAFGSADISTPAAPKDEEPMDSITAITVTVGGKTFSAALEDNESARSLSRLLPLTLDMSELNGNEKYFYLDQSLPADPTHPGQIHAGDLMLYGDNCLVLFYENFSSGYSYTRLGSIEDPAGLAESAGRGNVTVAFAAQEQ